MGERAAADDPMDDVDDVRFTAGVAVVGAALRFFDAAARVLLFDVALMVIVGGGELLLILFVMIPLEYSLRNSSMFSSTNGSCPSIWRCSCKA
jgi:hypothetical protein